MRAGDIVRVDLGIRVGSEPGFQRPAIVVTADVVLASNPRTVHVVPVTTNIARALPSEVRIDAGLDRPSVAQCHLCAVVSTERIIDGPGGHIGAVALAQLRAVIADLLDIG